jgi:hypothetical protein
MRQIFALSYVLLCVLVVIQALVLREALRRAARLSRLYSKSEDHQKREASADSEWAVPFGTRLPEFSAPLLGADGLVTRADLEGRETILLFVSPADAFFTRHRIYHEMTHAFQSMWEAVEGEVYLVCKGSREECERLTDGSRARSILDEEGWLFNSFLIDKTPRAVHLDEEARVTRYGEPDETGGALKARVDTVDHGVLTN